MAWTESKEDSGAPQVGLVGAYPVQLVPSLPRSGQGCAILSPTDQCHAHRYSDSESLDTHNYMR